jgi:hypothetical protein
MGWLDDIAGIRKIYDSGGVQAVLRKALGFSSDFTVTDDPANGRTLIALASPGGAGGGGTFNAGDKLDQKRLVLSDSSPHTVFTVPAGMIVFPDLLVIDNIGGPDDAAVEFRIDGVLCTIGGVSAGSSSTPPVQLIPPLGPGEVLTAKLASGTGPATVLLNLSAVPIANRGVQRTVISTMSTPTKVLDSPPTGKARIPLGVSGLEPISALVFYFNEDGSPSTALVARSTDGGLSGDTWNESLVNGRGQNAASPPVLLQGDEMFVAQSGAGALNVFIAYHDVDTIF